MNKKRWSNGIKSPVKRPGNLKWNRYNRKNETYSGKNEAYSDTGPRSLYSTSLFRLQGFSSSIHGAPVTTRMTEITQRYLPSMDSRETPPPPLTRSKASWEIWLMHPDLLAYWCRNESVCCGAVRQILWLSCDKWDWSRFGPQDDRLQMR